MNSNWLQESSQLSLGLLRSHIQSIEPKIGLLVELIEDFRKEFGKASFMDLQLALCLEDLLKALRKNQEVT